jgi:protein O-mannosyl-transferase
MKAATATPARPGALSSYFVAAAVLSAGLAAYANSWDAAFVFDDTRVIDRNPAIRRLWPPYDWLSFCPTRPLPYFTFAVNYAIHGYDVRGYHMANVAIHLATALSLLGFARRTLELSCVAVRYRERAHLLAAALALLWVTHPLTTQAVTYVYQRIESLAAMFCVLCLYSFVRAFGEPSRVRRGWVAASVACCFAAMVSKESAAGLPLIVLVFDRLFLCERWSDTLPRRYMHAAMFSSWGVAVGLMAATGSAYVRAGIGSVEGLTPLTYLLSQSAVILRYLRLSFWPTGLCLDYGWPLPRQWDEFVPQGIVVLALLGVTVVGLTRARLWSFPACAFFLLLAPTSSIVPIADLIFEHRMYLPLAAVLTVALCGFYEGLLRLQAGCAPLGRKILERTAVTFVAVAVAASAVATHFRNRDYESEVTLWHDIIAKAPDNPRPYFLLGRQLEEHRRRAEARRYFEQALAVDPSFVPALSRMAIQAADERRFDEAESYVGRIAQILPDSPQLLVRYGVLRAAQGRTDEAAANFSATLLREPENGEALAGLALLLDAAGRTDEAVELYRRFTAAQPDDPTPWNNLGVIYHSQGRYEEAVAAFRRAVGLRYRHVEARSNLGATLDRLGRNEEALVELIRAVEDDGDYLGGRINLGNALARRGRFAEAVAQFREALRIDPTSAQAAANLAQALADQAAAGDPQS